MARGVGLYHIFDVVRLEGLFEPLPRRHVLQLNGGKRKKREIELGRRLRQTDIVCLNARARLALLERNVSSSHHFVLLSCQNLDLTVQFYWGARLWLQVSVRLWTMSGPRFSCFSPHSDTEIIPSDMYTTYTYT